MGAIVALLLLVSPLPIPTPGGRFASGSVKPYSLTANPAPGSVVSWYGTDKNKWCVGEIASNPDWSHTTQSMWDSSGGLAYVHIANVGGVMLLLGVESTDAYRYISQMPSLTSGSEHSFEWCVTNGNTLSVWLDGVSVPVSTDAGPGLTTLPATLIVGATWGGIFRRLCRANAYADLHKCMVAP